VQDSTAYYCEPHETFCAAKSAPQCVATDTSVAFLFPAEVKTEKATKQRGTFSLPKQIEALMKAAIASDQGKPIFDAGEEWRGATLFAYFTGARLQDVANAPLNYHGGIAGRKPRYTLASTVQARGRRKASRRTHGICRYAAPPI
jgi:hypothetical protein